MELRDVIKKMNTVGGLTFCQFNNGAIFAGQTNIIEDVLDEFGSYGCSGEFTGMVAEEHNITVNHDTDIYYVDINVGDNTKHLECVMHEHDLAVRDYPIDVMSSMYNYFLTTYDDTTYSKNNIIKRSNIDITDLEVMVGAIQLDDGTLLDLNNIQ